MKQVLIDAENRESWNAFVAASPYGHTLQSWEWGEFKAGTGWEPLRLALCDEHGIRATAQVLIRRPLPFGFGKVAYVPKGPVLDYADTALLGQMLDALVRLAANRHVLSLKVEPEVVEPSRLGEELRRRGWRDSAPVQMRSTIWVDLSSSEDEILERQKQKTRYNTRLAQRKGVVVSLGTVGDLEAWYTMFRATARRDGFSIHGLEYYRLALQVLEPPGRARLLLAHHDGDLLAGIIVFRFGHGAQYMYGASSNDKRNLMAPYLLQWEGMRWASRVL